MLIDGNGSPVAFTSTAANRNEHQQVEPLLDRVEKHINSALTMGIIPIFEADKGYDAEQLGDKLLKCKIFFGFVGERSPARKLKKWSRY